MTCAAIEDDLLPDYQLVPDWVKDQIAIRKRAFANLAETSARLDQV